MAKNQNGGWLKWIIIAAVITIVIAGVVWHFKHENADAPQYQTVAVGRGELIQLVTATGTLNPVTNVQVGCQVSGTIDKIYVDYNSPVTAGQVIAEIDPQTYEAQVQQAEADLANAKANQELQKVEARRSSDLFTNNLISGSDYDTAIANLHEADAMVLIKEAALSNAVASLGYCKIYSPVAGIVISRAVDVGQTVASSFNTPTLFQIANDLTEMQIDTAVAEADIGGVEEKQHVDFTVDAYPYRTFHGTVVQVRNSPTNANNVVTYDCVIGVKNSDNKLKPGMTANVSITIAQKEDALKIPNSALRFRPPETANVIAGTNAPGTNAFAGGTSQGFSGGGRGTNRLNGFGGGMHAHNMEHQMMRTVYVLTGQGKDTQLKPVQIKIGISDGIYTEVLSGLSENDQVVTGLAVSATGAASGGNPFGGGFPRMR
ncbi:MAG TPA: efflux RND transporter periplasmic adaptor subunit [Verrucomicrobiae bacterium]|nr:efflux RND transporter periplasmic adaptor subunit [Verrucomicrobiae bacterium]